MHNIQDLKEKIFFESKNIIGILDKLTNVEELLSRQDLVDELANRISFLRLLEKNIQYFGNENSSPFSENQQNFSSTVNQFEDDSNNEVTEEEAIFNNELNEIDEKEDKYYNSEVTEEEAIFNNQLNEIVENEFHEAIVNFAEENPEADVAENVEELVSRNDITEEEQVFKNQLNEIDESELSEYHESALSFVDEERILANAEPDHDEDINEEMFTLKTTEEEAIFNNQLNEIDEFENEISDDQGNNLKEFEEEEKIQDNFEPEEKNKESVSQNFENSEKIPSIFDSENFDEEMLIEENEDQFIASNSAISQGEMATDTSNVENILSEIKHEAQVEEKNEEIAASTENDRRKIVEIDKPQIEKEIHPSDESFENLEAYHQEKKIKLSNIKGLKSIQTLFDDDPLERDFPEEKKEKAVKEETGSILKSNMATDFMEAEKPKPDFKLDLNDRIAFSKVLFGGSQSELNETVGVLNSFKSLEQAKEYLSDLYYERKWNKVDEYAQRLWILVENKFL
ncbi:hypothetical protein SAMN05421664_1595 [Chryseobacterium soldanellicola]|uniref:Uncharacterized protein n=1 Tax=Chryseobacterium soldanellicola TaxID=311333 RepID=A0A1H1AUX9_9FLAO|nr:hypothetical protein [Chryseobacterium soldanellicola]SDQ43489.1 hypothetical protein SAMN05421664_1595 [Chryseobacterium soldanellicola]